VISDFSLQKMKKSILFFSIALTVLFLVSLMAKKPVSLFDGKTFKGWEGDTLKTWKIENGSITGGSLVNTVPNNDFLCTQKDFENFKLSLKIKLVGSEGFINSGIQFRSKRLLSPAYEMTGYQADWGKNYFGCLYDESRRNKVLVFADTLKIAQWLKPNDWNDYEIRAQKNRIQIYLNGHETINYIEKEPSIPQIGKIALQIHGGGKALVSFKDIFITELP
jgi:hypothetical protein